MCVYILVLCPSPQGVSVEAVDPVFQARMLDMLKQTGRPEMVVGWYHSHPGFGCWLSGVDINTQQVTTVILLIPFATNGLVLITLAIGNSFNLTWGEKHFILTPDP